MKYSTNIEAHISAEFLLDILMKFIDDEFYEKPNATDKARSNNSSENFKFTSSRDDANSLHLLK